MLYSLHYLEVCMVHSVVLERFVKLFVSLFEKDIFVLYVMILIRIYCLQIRTLGMLRSRFESLPGAFNGCLIPPEKSDTVKKKGLKATLSRNYEAVSLYSICLN